MEIPTEDRSTMLPIEPDSNTGEEQSRYDLDSDTESLDSLTSSVLAYEYKNGRRYATYGSNQFWLPNDEHIYGMLFGGKLIFAPIKNPRRILDVGTGTGTWAVDVAMAYPNSRVTGTDISPNQPSWVPSNLTFEIDDAELDWNFSHLFDLIHIQNLNGAIRDWPRLFRQAYEYKSDTDSFWIKSWLTYSTSNLKPGGYFEVKEGDISAKCDDGSIPKEWSLGIAEKESLRACDSLGQTLRAPEYIKQWMEEAGFVDVEERIFRLPMNTWPKDPELKEIGRYQCAQHLEAVSPFALGLLVEVLGWSREETELFLVGVRDNIKDRSIHAYFSIRVVTGHRP
ncbi:class I SAM-dependent methyltransferase [Aspergillus affinis]|uniref:class I SAM-dependent methyltransferase n=1 Tax=Aspergillus affinis TaxID=1070780 RepID=UPI0022FE546D|nr:S-adenosyl-L-methionine-dependent methyltransferase [Aspergillus affinis]KAI9036605.1 S-adenosyl-L-methionine-dependent methyltransferase [Aspergillus affinis]